MDPDNYIDRLKVDLKLPSLRSPREAKDEADGIADRHVVPAVESVVEELGREIDATIPQIEIDVGRVRLQDLRDAVESALREALEGYRTSSAGDLSGFLPADRLRAFLETGIATWENGDVPFDPSGIVMEELENDPDSVIDSVGTLSEKGLASLLMAVFEVSFPGGEVDTVTPRHLSPVIQLRDAVLTRLFREFPETASVLTARLALWRTYSAQPVRSSEISWESSAPPVTSDPEEGAATDADAVQRPKGGGAEDREYQISSGHQSFKYVEISLKDIPRGHSVEALAYIGTPDAGAPDYIMTVGSPLRYYRKVAAGPAEEATAVEPIGKGLRTYAEVTLNQIGTEESGKWRPTRRESAPSSSEEESSRPEDVPPFYRYVEVRPQDIPAGYPVEVMDYVEMPDMLAPEYILSVDASTMRYYRKVAVGSVEEKSYSELSEDREQDKAREAEVVAREKRDKSRPDTVIRTYRYIEIRPQDIPAGYPIEVMDYKDSPDARDPKYILSVGTPLKYYRKDDVGSAEEDLGKMKEVLSEIPLVQKATEMPDESDASQPDARPSDGAVEDVFRPEATVRTYKYLEILPQDIPADYPVEVMDYKDNPDARDPEYILSVGTPMKYYRRVTVDAVEEAGRLTADVRSEEVLHPYRYVEILRQDIPKGYPVKLMEYAKYPGAEDPEYIRIAGASERYFRKVVAKMDASQYSQDMWEARDFELEVKEDRIPVSDAGLVLLHPFIGRMMENLGLVEEGEFVSPLARIRAVHLLRNLTGSDEPHHNHNLILEKVFCGIPIGYSIPPEWKPTEKENEETEALLQAVCKYWRPLSGSTIEALCGTFIRRPGAIERFEDTWTIRVEGNTIDILLDDLPWELSVIYLPWLEKPLAVEWQRD